MYEKTQNFECRINAMADALRDQARRDGPRSAPGHLRFGACAQRPCDARRRDSGRASINGPNRVSASRGGALKS